MTKDEFLEASKDFFIGALSGIDEDMPDGAYWQMHEDIAESLIDDCCDCLEIKKPKGIDGNDIAHYYFEHKETMK